MFLWLIAITPLLGQPLLLEPYLQVLTKQLPGRSSGAGGPLQLKTSNGETWERQTRGVARTATGSTRYFQGKRYLPCDEITGIAERADRSIVIQTSCGDSQIRFSPFRLDEKAKHYDSIAQRHSRLGLVADSRNGKAVSNDNDGLWTAMYAAAKLFEYKVTSDPAALKRAETAIRAVLLLEKITGVPGYPARSYIAANEEKPSDGFWYPSKDGAYLWKSDTSSDEIVGHFFLFFIAWDLLPPGPLRRDVQSTCRRMMDYIIAGGYHLNDLNGKPTRWGRWSPEYFSTNGRGDSPLNSIELLSFLRTARHLTGDVKYEREFSKVAVELGYLKIATEVKERQREINYSDEELAMLSFYPLLLLEKNPVYREPILQALDGWWVNIQREGNPLWNSIYELGHGRRDLILRKKSIATLERLPMDLRHWSIDNSWRKDLPLAAERDRFDREQSTVLLPPDERPVMKWNGNPFVISGGNDGKSEDDGTIFLLPYWMGRYHKLWTETGH